MKNTPEKKRLMGDLKMPGSLTPQQVERYETDGVVWPIDALALEEAMHYRHCLEEIERNNGGPLRGPKMFKTHLIFPWVDELIRHPKVLDAVESILGPNLLAWNSHWFIKEPGDGRYVGWHQDLTYWHLEPDHALTAWIALSPATAASGAMRMVAGTHTQDVVEHQDTWKAGAMLTRGQEIAVDVNEDEAVDIELAPGQISLHHHKIFHASPANTAKDRRIGLAVRYIPTHVRQVAISDDTAALVRGTDDFGNFQLEPRPTRNWDPDGMELQVAAADAQRRILYSGTDRTEFRADI
jgi:non-heme Fe2+,alpha-ketoglutarate-dependent halogenase